MKNEHTLDPSRRRWLLRSGSTLAAAPYEGTSAAAHLEGVLAFVQQELFDVGSQSFKRTAGIDRRGHLGVDLRFGNFIGLFLHRRGAGVVTGPIHPRGDDDAQKDFCGDALLVIRERDHFSLC